VAIPLFGLSAVRKAVRPSRVMTATVSDRPETGNYRAPRNLLFLDIAGSVHCGKVKSCTAAAWPLLILEVLTSTRRSRVAEFAVRLTQRPPSQWQTRGV
jgi:hypothetical protein